MARPVLSVLQMPDARVAFELICPIACLSARIKRFVPFMRLARRCALSKVGMVSVLARIGKQVRLAVQQLAQSHEIGVVVRLAFRFRRRIQLLLGISASAGQRADVPSSSFSTRQ